VQVGSSLVPEEKKRGEKHAKKGGSIFPFTFLGRSERRGKFVQFTFNVSYSPIPEWQRKKRKESLKGGGGGAVVLIPFTCSINARRRKGERRPKRKKGEGGSPISLFPTRLGGERGRGGKGEERQGRDRRTSPLKGEKGESIQAIAGLPIS